MCIRDSLHTGGCSAVIDASKFLYQFLTHPLDQKWLGLKHPVTGEVLECFGLPMGTGNSSNIASRLGCAFLRKIRTTCTEFQGLSKLNCFWSGFQFDDFDPTLGHGWVTLSRDDGPAVLMWIFINDIIIHAQTKAKGE